MIDQPSALAQSTRAIGRAPVTALLGPRQCGKTTLARTLAAGRGATFLDLESDADRLRLQNPEFVLGTLRGLVQEADALKAGDRCWPSPCPSSALCSTSAATPSAARGC